MLPFTLQVYLLVMNMKNVIMKTFIVDNCSFCNMIATVYEIQSIHI